MARAVILSMIIFWLSSCVPSQNTFVSDIKGQKWDGQTQVEYSNVDTMAMKDILVTVRYTSMLEDSTLGMELKITDPDGFYMTDSLRLETPKTNKHFAHSTMLYRTGNRFKNSGNYIFTFSPLDKGIKGVTAVGIIID